MKVVYLLTGSGGSFYCGNCYRDMIYLKSIRKVPGTVASAIPLYLPPDASVSDKDLDQNVFFGAISLYLREKVPFLRNMPSFFDKILDSPAMLKMAAKRAGTTRTEGMEDMTLNMITGKKAFPEKELQRLTGYLGSNGKPDIIHLSNALVIGLAGQLKKKMNVKIVCSLLNEDDWINDMAEPWQSQAWELIAGEAHNVDAFITPSRYYRDFFISKTRISSEKFNIVPLGFEPGSLLNIVKKDNWPSIGYFCRINSHNGFDKLVDAFIKLRTENRIPSLKLHVSGGYTGDDKSFISAQIEKIRIAGLSGEVKIYDDFIGSGKEEFFSNIDLISVPVRKYDGYGLYLLEAAAAGVPAVQPSTGAFPEIIEGTAGGVLYLPDDVEQLSKSIELLVNDRKKVSELGTKARENVLRNHSLLKMSEGLAEVYNKVIV
ncbi:MAG TPA: glycosyltransferase family 4 protein [Bacteroidales bacterium]|jgi:glycosyltransferase involved in cell wall biosynthesis|nr:glycosyltransferase family 4 protein [Bacteroidales bacterium]